jgi:hypothetical protein
MKTYIIFSSREPFLIVTQGSIGDREVIERLRRIGCTKFISREVPVDYLRRQYGRRFEVMEAAINNGHILRVLDSSGTHVFQNVDLANFGTAYRSDSVVAHA